MKLKWVGHWLSHAELGGGMSPCVRRRVGAVVVDGDNAPLALGYNGTTKGVGGAGWLCGGMGECERERLGVVSGERMEVGCHHAEANCLMNMLRAGVSARGCVMFVTLAPCEMCARLIAHSGLRGLYFMCEEFSVWGGGAVAGAEGGVSGGGLSGVRSSVGGVGGGCAGGGGCGVGGGGGVGGYALRGVEMLLEAGVEVYEVRRELLGVCEGQRLGVGGVGSGGVDLEGLALGSPQYVRRLTRGLGGVAGWGVASSGELGGAWVSAAERAWGLEVGGVRESVGGVGVGGGVAGGDGGVGEGGVGQAGDVDQEWATECGEWEARKLLKSLDECGWPVVLDGVGAEEGDDYGAERGRFSEGREVAVVHGVVWERRERGCSSCGGSCGCGGARVSEGGCGDSSGGGGGRSGEGSR